MTGIRERLETAREERWGILADLVFAIVWVTTVDLFFRLVDGPTWAYYMLMVAGVVAYFGFFTSLKVAKETQE
ncbi:hypothetical protein [Halosolutus gelatinilyticus]|uniref:hypothetical protein n=1 Tax=Halosolutus gelatinilyticus TaxID=2931975 RepID=UPI001FF65FBE|nr:hypothetical protein [Halosolutus gelatinilyticus]